MFDWLGIGHLVELTAGEAVLGFLTPLFVMAAFFVLQMVIPGKRVPGYVIDAETGQPRSYRLNGLAVFLVAQVLWWFELTGMPRDWFYRSSLYAVAGGTVLAVVMTLIAVFSQPEGDVKNKFLACWFGRAQEMQFFNNRIDLKMYFYVVGGTMLSLNAFSGAVWHYERFGADANPGAYLFAAFFTLYVFDYFVFERVQLYTFDIIYERLGFKMFWGGLFVYGWMFIIPMWGMAAHPDPGHAGGWRALWLIGAPALYAAGWCISRGANMQKYNVQTMARPQLSGHQAPDHRGRRAQDSLQRLLGRIAASQLPGRRVLRAGPRCGVGSLRQPVGVALSGVRLCAVQLPADGRRQALRAEVRPREMGGVPRAGPLPHRSRHLLSRLASPSQVRRRARRWALQDSNLRPPPCKGGALAS